MLVVGLTGGIGSGKSSVAQILASNGAEIIDTDLISHALTAPGGPALQEIASQLGSNCLLEDGSLNRTVLRQRVFSDPQARKALENILHPPIRSEVNARLSQPSKAPYRVLAVPLLLETQAYQNLIHRVLVIDCPEELQIQRAMARSSLTQSQVESIMNVQLSRALRLQAADDVIFNDSTLEKLTEDSLKIHKKYLILAQLQN